MKQKILYGLMSILMLCAFVACSDDDGSNGGKISVPKGQPTNISLAANEVEGQITIKSNVNISAWVSDVKDGAPTTDIEWITVNQPHKDDGIWFINYSLQTNTTGTSRTAYIVVVAEDVKLSFTITQSDESNPEMPDVNMTGMVTIKGETFEDFLGDGSYKSDGVFYYELILDAGMPRGMVHLWTDEIVNGPGQSGDSECKTKQVT